jgi:hypothetical protein
MDENINTSPITPKSGHLLCDEESESKLPVEQQRDEPPDDFRIPDFLRRPIPSTATPLVETKQQSASAHGLLGASRPGLFGLLGERKAMPWSAGLVSWWCKHPAGACNRLIERPASLFRHYFQVNDQAIVPSY